MFLQVKRACKRQYDYTILLQYLLKVWFICSSFFFVSENAKCIFFICAIRQMQGGINRKERKTFFWTHNNHWNFTQDNDDDNMKNMPFISKVKWSVTYFMFKCCTFFFSYDLWLSYFHSILIAGQAFYHRI